MLQPETIASFLDALGSYALPVSLLISIIIAVLGLVPSIFVTGANILLFGPLYGFLISWLGEMLGAVVSFYLYRTGFRRPFTNLAQKHPLLGGITESTGWQAGLFIFQARLFPFLPSGIVTFAGAVSKINPVLFLLATALGKIPSLILEALVSYDFINMDRNWIRLVFTLVSLTGLYLLWKKNKRASKKCS
ncbi:TVP38/TMEM64 family protein [Candidatus Formimonas warabiya]|uniref:TVP38/TMEM64 family membrane protein n=1 Tax=Formimonas warabiya TaxID=1761012 RepID=A0A3G1L243_FORW1|nr:VTT domain-containing protein [Candidatus Formimonas warabiya]ATW28535.1 alkaline phosphatase [Candidatus Formimonas warabiya]